MIDQDFKLSEQNALLRRLTGNGIADLNELNNEMERYKQMLEMFDEIIKEQVSFLKECCRQIQIIKIKSRKV